MIRFLLAALCSIYSLASFAQQDSIFLKGQPAILAGTGSVNAKKQTITIRTAGTKNLKFGAGDIDSAHVQNDLFVSRQVGISTFLLQVLIKGEYGLLLHEASDQFYVLKNDSLFVMTRTHYLRAMPLIFGEQIVQRFFQTYTAKPVYSIAFMRKLVSFANKEAGSIESVYEKSLRKFKTTVSIGPYAGFATGSYLFDTWVGNQGGRLIFRKSDSFRAVSFPVGLQASVGLFRKFNFDFSFLLLNTPANDIYVPNMGAMGVSDLVHYSDRKKFDRNLHVLSVNTKSFQIDFSATFKLIQPDKSKIIPFIFAGPTYASIRNFKIGYAAIYRDTPESPDTYYRRGYNIERKPYMMALNAGAGVSYAISNKLAVRGSVKYTRGVFAKIRGPQTIYQSQNDTGQPGQYFQAYIPFTESSFNFEVSQLQCGIALSYKL